MKNNKLQNLISLDDFKSGWKAEQAKKTKRTETGLDVLKENVEEIIPAGVPMEPKFDMSYEEKLSKIIEELQNLNDFIIEEIVNSLREALLEMEQQGFIDEETTDMLDDKHDGDWVEWIKDVIQLPDFPEEGLNNVLDLISSEPNESDELTDDYDDDVECPDCEGSGVNEDDEECERCGGEGRVGRPYDIPPDDWSPEYVDEDDIDPAGGHGLHSHI